MHELTVDRGVTEKTTVPTVIPLTWRGRPETPSGRPHHSWWQTLRTTMLMCPVRTPRSPKGRPHGSSSAHPLLCSGAMPKHSKGHLPGH